MKRVYILLITICLCGCATVQLYPGPEKAKNAVVMINGMSNWDISAGGLAVKVCKFDGKPLSSCEPFIAFLPGRHTLTIELTDYGLRVGDDVDITKDFLAGDRYELDVEFIGGTRLPAMLYTGNANKKSNK